MTREEALACIKSYIPNNSFTRCQKCVFFVNCREALNLHKLYDALLLIQAECCENARCGSPATESVSLWPCRNGCAIVNINSNCELCDKRPVYWNIKYDLEEKYAKIAEESTGQKERLKYIYSALLTIYAECYRHTVCSDCPLCIKDEYSNAICILKKYPKLWDIEEDLHLEGVNCNDFHKCNNCEKLFKDKYEYCPNCTAKVVN